MFRVYAFTQEPESQLYFRLLDYAIGRCSIAIFVVRPGLGLSSRGAEVIDELSPFLQSVDNASRWPGTELLDQKAQVYYWKYNLECVKILKTFSCRLYNWIQPELPEDLCLLRKNGAPWLVSVAHEHDAYVLINDHEYESMMLGEPELHAILKLQDSRSSSDPLSGE